MDGSPILREKDDMLFDIAPAPAGGTVFDFDNSSASTSSSAASSPSKMSENDTSASSKSSSAECPDESLSDDEAASASTSSSAASSPSKTSENDTSITSKSSSAKCPDESLSDDEAVSASTSSSAASSPCKTSENDTSITSKSSSAKCPDASLSDEATSFHTGIEYNSRASLEISAVTNGHDSSSHQVECSSAETSFSENSLNQTASVNASPARSMSRNSGALISNILADESEIIQTMEYLDTKAESNRAKRFDYLLKQTEIWGHFMKPAYQEALTFAGSEKLSQSSAGGISDSQSSKVNNEDSPQTSATSKGRKKGKRKAPLFSIPPIASTKPDLGSDVPSYVTHFDDSPTFIQGGSMRDYQVRGLNWIVSLYEKGLSGILADEMGLGKTVQAISMLGYLKHSRVINGPHLIIAPKSTLPNWMNELKRWCPTLKSICLIGAKDERRSFIKKTFLPKRWNVCVTSYDIARIEKSTLAQVNYHYVIIDEAQKIKNENSLLSVCVRQLKSAVRLLLTGTPLQNNLHELWALLNFLLPDVFSSSEDFDSWFNESSCMGNQTLVDRLHAVLRPFLLRRIKSDVEKSLLPKTEMRLYVQLAPMQREWYRKILMNDIEVINSKTGRSSKKALHNVIMHIRKCCNHPYLFEGAEPKPFTTDTHLVTNCGKMIVLDKLLLKLKAQQSRVLLFCQMTRMLDILEDYCIWRNFEYCRLDGDTDYAIRQEDIDAFNAPNSEKFIYLLSTRAGGLGINLATADIVILYDSDWNPQIDLQAMDRAHRIGQTKQVKVFRFVVQDTAEEKIIECAAAKLHLDRMVIQQGRLVGADANKGPNVVEMLSVVRFGAEKLLKTGVNEGVSEADIDTILAQSKIRSDEMDRRLNGMDEDNLKELTIEQVEFNWEKKPISVTNDSNDTFNFEGKNYRELRKRKTTSQAETASMMLGGKRRKDMDPVHSERANVEETQDDETDSLYNESSASRMSIGDDDDRISDLSKSQKKPALPHDFHFCPPYIWELYWRQVDYYRKCSGDHDLDQFPEELPLQDIQMLKVSEVTRLQKCDKLSGAESRELNTILKFEGFFSWKKKHFTQFIEAMKHCGPDNLEDVAKEISKKEVEEVVKFSQVFWMRCHELQNFEKLMEKLGRVELVAERRKRQQKLLDERVKNANTLSNIFVKYDPQHWIGQRFSAEDDAQLLINISEIGMLTPDVFDVLRSKFLESRKGVSAFLRTRSKEELHMRFNLLMFMIEKETASDKLASSPDTSIKQEIGIVKSIHLDSSGQSTNVKPVKSAKPKAAKKRKVADPTLSD